MAGAVAIVLAVVAAVVWAARDGDDAPIAATGTTAGVEPLTSTTAAVTTTTASTTTAIPSATTVADGATTTPEPAGNAGAGCLNGWTAPGQGTSLRAEPLDIIRQQMGITGQFRVIEMRYFTGPEVPWILEPRSPFVEWWYVKAQLVENPAFRARWLVARRWEPPRRGIAAVAPFETEGYRSPDWRDFIGDRPPHAVEGLPGMWAGDDFDFTVGEDGETPGLPDEVVHCLDGT